MESKLRQLMKHEGINSSRLAEILGIQASGISHIMSGRNKPSFDFLLKLLQRFPQINPDWLLLDKGPMYRDEIKNKGQTASTGTGARSGASAVLGTMGVGSSAQNVQSAPSIAVGTAANAVRDGGLFGPDNDNIIRSGGNPYTSGDPHHGSGERDNPGYRGNFGSSAAISSTPPNGQPHPGERSTPQNSIYQPDNFTRSASIERIVVFYKDKTFSEYQPG